MEKKNPAFPLLLLIISKSSFRTKPCKVNFLLIVFLPSLPITILQHREMTSKPPKNAFPGLFFPSLSWAPPLPSALRFFPGKSRFSWNYCELLCRIDLIFWSICRTSHLFHVAVPLQRIHYLKCVLKIEFSSPGAPVVLECKISPLSPWSCSFPSSSWLPQRNFQAEGSKPWQEWFINWFFFRH